MSAARAFAAALCCADGGCGVCDTCRKAARGIHSDITVVEPAGSLITVDQVREMNRSLNLHPGESRARVFIIAGAEALGAEGANAFLKSLEEPPPFVFFLLLADQPHRVLPTIVSRCQVVRFRQVPAADIEARLAGRHGLSPVLAQAYARVSGGSLVLAEALAADPALASRRQRYLEIAAALSRGSWEGGAGQLAAELEASAQEAGELAAGAEEEPPEGFAGTAARKREQDAHRRSTAAQKREMQLALTVMSSWFHDMMVTAAGAGEAVLNKDYELELEDQALPSRLDGYRRALAVLENARAKLGYNIDLGLTLTAMFYQLSEVL